MKDYTYIVLMLIVIMILSLHRQANAVKLYSNNGKFLGNVNTNQFDKDSVNNPFGKYGSPFSPDSTKNPFSQYGSPFGTDSIIRPNNSIHKAPLTNTIE